MEKIISSMLNSLSYLSTRLAGRGAFYFFSHPIGRAKQRPGESVQIQQAMTDELIIDGVKVMTYKWGSGTKRALFVHGWNSRGSRCSQLVTHLLPQGYTVLSFDAQGHGVSAGKTTNILEYTKIIKALHQKHGDFEVILSHSFGTLCAFNAVREGVHAKAIVSFNGVCDFHYVVERFCHHLRLRSPFYHYLRRTTEVAFQQAYGRDNIWTELSADYAAEKNHARLLVIADAQDEIVVLSEAEKFKAAYGQQVTVLTTEGLGHHKALKDEKVMEQVVTFLQQLP